MGSKSSGSAHTPVEAKDSLKSTQFVRILDLLGEGSLSGWGNGGDSDDAMLKSTYFNDTPVLSETGKANFKGAKVAYLLGSEDQGYLPNFDTTENTVAVGTEVKNATPIVRTVTDSQLDRVIVTIRTGQMVRVNDQGDQNKASVDLVVELMKEGATFSSRNVHIKGKTSDHFFRDVEFENLPEAPFQIRVRRVTGDSSSSKLQNQTYFASYVEIINAKLSYPHSAVVGVEFDSELFGASIPTRNYLVKGLQIKVPSNYDPEARTYTGFWDGTFKVAFSNNPAWVFYDLVTSKRYGLGRKISTNQVDKWALYSVAQYCDQLVDNGQGAMEPRFTCNAYLTEMRQAYEVLQDLVSCFRGMYVWDGQNVSVTIDRKSDPVAMYTNSNVMDGIFSYSSSPLNTIATAVQVQYVDAEDGYRTKTEYVSDDLAVRRYGLNVKRITSFGCTSRSQAIRTGKWLLETSRLERQTVTFSVGRAGLKHLPYDIIQVVDNDYAGVDMAGRIESVNQNLVTLDRPVSDLTGTEFSFLNALGKLVTSEIVKQVSPTVLQLVDVIVPHVTATFVIRSKGLGKRFFRALTISEDQDNGSYTINAVEHIPEKESVVDNGVEFEPAPNTIYDRLPVITGTQVQQDGDGVTVEWSGQGSTSGVTYQVKVYRNDLLMDTYNDLVTPTVTLSKLQPGRYKMEIRARNKNGQWSEPEIREFDIDYNITTLQATPELWSVRLNWTLPNTAGVGYKTQIWYSETDEFTTAMKLADVATPTTTLTHTNLELMQKYYYWARIEDAKGNTGEPSNSVWCGPSTDEKLITEYLKGKVDATLIADETLTIAKFAKSIIPPRFVVTLPVLPNPDYAINSIVTYQGALYQNIGNVWKPMFDQEALDNSIDQALDKYKEDIPEEVSVLPSTFNGKNFVIYQGRMYVWNGSSYEVTGINPELQKNIPVVVTSIPTTFNGSNNLVMGGQLYAWNGTKYVSQFDENAVDQAIDQAVNDLHTVVNEDLPRRVTSVPASFNGYNNLVLSSTGQMYSWSGTKYATQFDKASVTTEVNTAIAGVSKDIPYRLSAIPTTYNGYNNLVLSTNGQMYSWNGTEYVVQFDQSAVETTVTQIAQDLVEQKVSELANDVPRRVASIPSSHNGSNMLVLTTTGQVYAWDGSAYKVQFQQTLTQGVIDASTIQGTKIANGTISTAQLAANSVTASQIVAGSITTVKMATNSVTTAQLAAGSVTATQIEANAIVAGKIAANAVTTASIAANAVTTNEIAANTITGNKIAANAITASHIVAGTISTTELAANSVTTAKIAALAVTASELAANSVIAGKIAVNAITSNNIAAGSITSDKVAANAITTDKLYVTAGTNLIPNPAIDVDLTEWKPHILSANVSFLSKNAYTNAGLTSNLIRLQVPASTTVATQTSVFSHGGGYPNYLNGAPVKEGDVIRLRYKAFRNTKYTDVLAAYIWGTRPDNTGVALGSLSLQGSTLGTLGMAGVMRELEVTIPSNIVSVRAYFLAQNIPTGAGFDLGDTFIGDVEMFNMTTSQLIVDGAITADKVAANAITAGKIAANSIFASNINANAIGASHIVGNAISTNHISANAVTTSQIAAGAVTANEIAANTITGNKIVANAITASHITAGTITAVELATNSVTAAKIAVGAVGADQIAARAISTDKMVIGLGNNLVPDPNWESGFENWKIVTGAGTTTLLERGNSLFPSTTPATRVVRLTGPLELMTHKGPYSQEADGIPVVAGEEYLLTLDIAKAYSPAASGSIRLQGYFYCQDGVQRSTAIVNTDIGALTPGVWHTLKNNITVPATAVKMRMYIYATPFSGVAEICNPTIFKRATGELIVDGAITTDKLMANAVTATKILAGSIQASHIAAGSITGDRIAANQTLTAPTILGGTINIGNGAFSVDSQGDVKVTKGSFNINDNFIVDSAGNLTAKSGRFEGTVSADSIDTPVAQTFFANVGTYTTMIPPSTRARRLFISTFTCQVIPPPSWNHDLRGTYKLLVKVFQRTASGVVSILRQYGAEANSSGSENYTVYGRSVSRTLYNIEIDVPLGGASYLVDVEAQWSFESTTFVRRNLEFGRIETNGASERTGTKIGQISRHLMHFTMYRNN